MAFVAWMMFWSLSVLPEGEPPAFDVARVTHQVIVPLTEGVLAGERTGPWVGAFLGEEEDSVDDEVFDFGFSDILPDVVTLKLMTPDAGWCSRAGGLTFHPTPLRC